MDLAPQEDMPLRKDRFVLDSRSNFGREFGVSPSESRRSADSFSVEVVWGLHGLRAIREDWQRLIDADPHASPYASWNWIESWIEAYGKQREFLTVVCFRGYEVVGIVPFTWKKRTSPLEIRKMWMLGFHSWVGRNGLTEEPVFAMVSDEAAREAVWRQVHNQLRRTLDSGPWDSIAYRKFGQGIEGCSVVEQLQGNTEVQDFLRGCEYVQLPETWEEYLASISKSMRENIPYYQKKLQKEGVDYKVEFAPAEKIGRAVDDLIRLHKKRTYTDPSLQHVDYFGDLRQQKLLRVAVTRMVRSGEAQLATLSSNGKVIAAQVFLLNRNMMLAHYSGFDPAWSKFSPLFVLQTEVIRDAIGNGTRMLNLLRGNASWQRRWGADSTNQIVDVTLGRRKFVPRLRQVLRHREGKMVYSVANAPAMRRIRAAYRTWQLGLKSA